MINAQLPHLPERTSKPRQNGIAMVMDKGLSIREAEDFVSNSADYTDFVKFGFGTSLVTPNVKAKIKLYREANIKVYVGGTLFEAYVIRDQFDAFRKYIDWLGIDTVEISDGSMSMDHDIKCEYIHTLSRDFTVLSEVGSKDRNDAEGTPGRLGKSDRRSQGERKCRNIQTDRKGPCRPYQ
jgi:phosphosulfolactate synthase